MKHHNTKYRLAVTLTWLAAGAALFLFYLHGINPQKQSIRHLKTTIDQSEKQLLDLKNAAAPQARETLQRLRLDQQNALQRFLTDSDQPNNLTFVVNHIARQRNLTDFLCRRKETSSRLDLAPFQLIDEQSIKLSCLTSFQEFACFLNELERTQPVIFVDQFLIERVPKTTDRIKVEMELTALVKKPLQTPPTAQKTLPLHAHSHGEL